MLRPPSKTTTDLINTKAIIADADCWTQGRLEQDGKRCTWGAMLAVSSVPYPLTKSLEERVSNREMVSLLGDAARKILPLKNQYLSEYYNIVEVNDHIGHDAVMHMFDLAIEASLVTEPAS